MSIDVNQYNSNKYNTNIFFKLYVFMLYSQDVIATNIEYHLIDQFKKAGIECIDNNKHDKIQLLDSKIKKKLKDEDAEETLMTWNEIKEKCKDNVIRYKNTTDYPIEYPNGDEPYIKFQYDSGLTVKKNTIVDNRKLFFHERINELRIDYKQLKSHKELIIDDDLYDTYKNLVVILSKDEEI
jgi:hypothetical protein